MGSARSHVITPAWLGDCCPRTWSGSKQSLSRSEKLPGSEFTRGMQYLNITIAITGILFSIRNRNLGTCKASLESQALGTILFMSDASNQRGCVENNRWEIIQVSFQED